MRKKALAEWANSATVPALMDKENQWEDCLGPLEPPVRWLVWVFDAGGACWGTQGSHSGSTLGVGSFRISIGHPLTKRKKRHLVF